MAVASQAPFHARSLSFGHERHLVHLSVTRLAADPFTYMNAVIKVNVVWEIVHAVPDKRLAGSEAFTYGFQHGAVFPHDRMAFHTDFCRGNSGKRRFFRRSVAEAAVNSKSVHMVFVAERDGLSNGHIDFG